LCAFNVYFNVLADKEYLTVAPLSDGSAVYTYTGAMKVSLTNDVTGKTIVLNVSGPSTTTISPDGKSLVGEFRGHSLVMGYNFPAFGLPSNLIYTDGLFVWTETATPDWWGGWLTTGWPHFPAHVTDMCAALS
jgi:hypothetical protein